MQVLFDLRPAAIVHAQEQQIEPIRLTAVSLFVVFVIVSLFNIFYASSHLLAITKELAILRGEENSLSSQVGNYNDMVTEMRSFKDRLTKKIDFINQELPTVEFLATLEGAVPQGLKITTVEIRQGNVRMEGVAVQNDSVVEFGKKLAQADSIILQVDAPITTKAAVGTKMRTAFSITCNIKNITEITEITTAPKNTEQPASADIPAAEVVSAEKGAAVK